MSFRSLLKPILRFRSLIIFIGCAGSISAQNTAWNTARNYLPADTLSVVGIDVAALNQTQIWPQLTARIASTPAKGKNMDTSGWKQLLAKGPGDTAPLSRYVTAMVVASDGKDSALFISIHGTTTDQFARALVEAKAGSQPAKATLPLGKITGYKTGDGQLYYFCFISNETLVCLPPLTDRAGLQKWTSSSRVPVKLASTIAQTNRSATIWMASIDPQEIDGGFTTTAQYGTLNFAAGKILLDLHLLAASAQAAADIADNLNKSAVNFKAIAQLQPQFATLLRELSVSASGSQVIVRDSVDEKDLEPLVAMAAGAVSL